MDEKLELRINDLWEQKVPETDALNIVQEVIEKLDRGEIRIAETHGDDVIVHEWIKRAVILYFRYAQLETSEAGPFKYLDRVPLKSDWNALGVRAVPGAIARYGSFIDRGVVLMPSYVNIGARVGNDTMVDTWATVGSCAQIGANVHLSGGVGIGGVLEPPQAAPVIVEDNAFIGSRCIIVEGARIREGAVIGAGAFVSPSIPVIDAESGEEISRGDVPAWCVAVSATRSRDFAGGQFGLPCLLIIRRLSEGERLDKTSLNDILREHNAVL